MKPRNTVQAEIHPDIPEETEIFEQISVRRFVLKPHLLTLWKLVTSRQSSFVIVGMTVMFLGFLVLYGLVEVGGLNPNQAKIVELAISIELNFLGNRYLTWNDRYDVPWLGSLIRFNLIRAVTAVLSWLVFAALTTWVGVPYLVASAISVLAAMVINYRFGEKWVFPASGVARLPKIFLGRSGHRLVVLSTSFAGLALSWVLLGAVGFAYAAISFMVAVLLFIACSSLWFKLHAWQTPENMEDVGYGIVEKPQFSFSILYPVRGENLHVIRASVGSIVRQNHPDFEVFMIVSGDDDEETRSAVEQVHSEFVTQTKIHYVYGPVKNKPRAIMSGLELCTKQKVGLIDAESIVAPGLLVNVDSVFARTGADTVVSGVQLMNFQDNWVSLQNCLEYYWWFASRLHFQAKNEFIPYPGNSLFIDLKKLLAVGGWHDLLTEDADLGVRMCVAGYRTVVVYDPKLATREEAPTSMKVLVNQRTRWMQGFFQTYLAGDWRQLRTTKQRMLARYSLLMPFAQALTGIILPVSLIAAVWLKFPTLLAMATFLPLIPGITAIAADAVALCEFGKSYELKVRLRDYFKLVIGSFPYQFLLSVAGIKAAVRQQRGKTDWYKTAHSGSHHLASDSYVPAGETA